MLNVKDPIGEMEYQPPSPKVRPISPELNYVAENFGLQDPELARVGLNESEARHNGIEYRLVTMPMSAVLRTRTVSEQRGLMKMLIAKKSDEVLGFTAFGFEASEMMVAVQTAMIGRLPYTAIRDAIFTHPTMSEGLNELLGQVKDS